MSKPRKDGSTLYEHLRQVELRTGRWPREYEPLPPPEGAEHIWELYWELRETAKLGFNGPERISFMEIDAWQRVTGLKIASFVLTLLLKMDMAYLQEHYRKTT